MSLLRPLVPCVYNLASYLCRRDTWMTRPYLACLHRFTNILKNEYPAHLCRMCDAPESEVLAAVPRKSGFCYPPVNVECADPRPPIRIAFPEIHAVLLTNQMVDVNCSYPYDEKRNCFYVDPYFMESIAYADNSGGHMFAHGRQKAIARRKVSPVSIAEGIFLGGNGSSNYYHWLVEIASKLQMLESLPESLRAFPLLVNSRLLQMPGYAEVLKVLAPCKHVLYLEEGESYLVRKGIFIEPFVSAPFNLREGNKFAAGQFSARPEAIHYLRNAVLRAAVEPQTEQWPQRIYLPCIRRPYSQDELIALAAKRGFVVIHPEQYPFLKQAAFFANARVIIGPLGAAWANLVFASPRCKGLSWMPMEKGEEAAYSNIAGILGIDLQYLVYSSGVQSTMRFYNHSYYICPAAFEKALDRIIKQQCNE